MKTHTHTHTHRERETDRQTDRQTQRESKERYLDRRNHYGVNEKPGIEEIPRNSQG